MIPNISMHERYGDATSVNRNMSNGLIEANPQTKIQLADNLSSHASVQVLGPSFGSHTKFCIFWEIMKNLPTKF